MENVNDGSIVNMLLARYEHFSTIDDCKQIDETKTAEFSNFLSTYGNPHLDSVCNGIATETNLLQLEFDKIIIEKYPDLFSEDDIRFLTLYSNLSDEKLFYQYIAAKQEYSDILNRQNLIKKENQELLETIHQMKNSK